MNEGNWSGGGILKFRTSLAASLLSPSREYTPSLLPNELMAAIEIALANTIDVAWPTPGPEARLLTFVDVGKTLWTKMSPDPRLSPLHWPKLRDEFKEVLEREALAHYPPESDVAEHERLSAMIAVIRCLGMAPEDFYTKEGSEKHRWVWEDLWDRDGDESESDFYKRARETPFPFWQDPAFVALYAQLETYQFGHSFHETESRAILTKLWEAVAPASKRHRSGFYEGRCCCGFCFFTDLRVWHRARSVDKCMVMLCSINLPQHWFFFLPSERSLCIAICTEWLACLKENKDGKFAPLPIPEIGYLERASSLGKDISRCSIV